MIIRQVLLQPSMECYVVTTDGVEDWRLKIQRLMKQQDDGQCLRPADTKKIARYSVVRNDLYRRGFSTRLLKCLSNDEA